MSVCVYKFIKAALTFRIFPYLFLFSSSFCFFSPPSPSPPTPRLFFSPVTENIDLQPLSIQYQYVVAYSSRLYLKLKKGQPIWSSGKLRLWNEVATLLLFGIVFVIVFKTRMSWIWAVGGFIALAVLLMLGIRFYKKQREKKK